nr:tetratricopeptide repeat protein [uncultured Allomuricauda sp.]
MPNQPSLTTEKSLVVLPFKNLSGDDSYEYFSDGITEEIINALSKIDGLKVTARTSAFAFKGKPTDIRLIGNELGVTNAVEGSVRIFKERIRITTQLTRTDNGFLLWSDRFDRKLDDVFELQDEVSLLIADKIRENFGHLDIEDSLSEIQTSNLSAYQWYLKGRYYQLTWNLVNMEKAIGYYERSAQEDPSYSDPLVARGWCYAILASWGHIDRTDGLDKANFYVQKGMKMNPTSYLGHFADATISFWGNWEFDKGYAQLMECLKENQYFSEGREALAELYTALGLFDKATVETEQILKINPLSPNHFYTAGNIHYLSGNYKKALECFEKSLERDQSFDLSRHLKVACLLFLKEKDALFEYASDFLDDVVLYYIQGIYSSINEDVRFDFDATKYREDYNMMFAWDFYYLIHTGQMDRALVLFEEMINNRVGQFVNFQFDPFLAPLRSDPKFQLLRNHLFDGVQLLAIPSGTDTSSQAEGFSKSEYNLLDAELVKTLDDDEEFLDSNLSLRSLALKLQVHPNTLSKYINDQLQTNFNELINARRLKHFQKIALLPENKQLTLLGLAYESGFNSKTVFNTYFKKVLGVTPKRWIQANQ